MNKLSILIPAFNEAQWISQLLQRVVAVDLVFGVRKEIVLVDDGSTDTTASLIQKFTMDHPEVEFTHIAHARNQGKGACLREAIRVATGDLMVVQDADLEYDPQDYNTLLKTLAQEQTDAVYGSRFVAGHCVTSRCHRFVNWVLTRFSNAFTGWPLTDVHTCYKMIRADVIKRISLEERRFGFCPEITAKLARIPGVRIAEVPITYRPRDRANGKKIGIRDGLRALWCTLKYSRMHGFGIEEQGFSRKHAGPGGAMNRGNCAEFNRQGGCLEQKETVFQKKQPGGSNSGCSQTRLASGG